MLSKNLRRSMSKVSTDTIVAIATAPGKGSIGIIRICGKESYGIACKLTQSVIKARYAHFLKFRNLKGEIIDQGIVIYFKAPRSYTGEDVVEFQAHGGTAVLQMLLKTVIKCGARLAKPGEFTELAYLNNKIDLAQAEAIADIINASSEQAARSSMNSLQGEFSKYVNILVESFVKLRVRIEAMIDFPEEEIEITSNVYVKTQLLQLREEVQSILKKAKNSMVIREGIKVVIIGQPNSGKSSLLNALSGKASAITSDIEGTTRDIVDEYIHIDGVLMHIIDTAGLRTSDDPIESEGIRRALQAVKEADHILLVSDNYSVYKENIENQIELNFLNEINPHTLITYVHNKIDLRKIHRIKNHSNQVYISAKNGIGIERLKRYLITSLGYSQTIESNNFMARERHIIALKNTKNNLCNAYDQLMSGDIELLAEELKIGQNQLSSITGEFSSDSLLGEIFSNFCIGK